MTFNRYLFILYFNRLLHPNETVSLRKCIDNELISSNSYIKHLGNITWCLKSAVLIVLSMFAHLSTESRKGPQNTEVGIMCI